MTLTVGSLFSGIGGLELGLERAGMRVIWQSEIDPYASRVLKKHWPTVPNLGDVTKIDWSSVERPDLICGGFPCQPFSLAGRGAGKEDDRYLWPHFARCLRVLRPRWALLENVPGLLVRGFGDVLADLAAIGYDTEWESLPAAAFGAPHLRWRVFVVAHAGGGTVGDEPVFVFGRGGASVARDDGPERVVADADSGRFEEFGEPELGGLEGARRGVVDGCRAARRFDDAETVADADGERRGGRSGVFGPGRRGQSEDGGDTLADPAGTGRGRPGAVGGDGTVSARGRETLFGGRGGGVGGAGESEPAVCGVADGLSEGLDVAVNPWAAGEWPDVPRTVGRVVHRPDRLRCLGNAVVPQVAQWIGERILEVV